MKKQHTAQVAIILTMFSVSLSGCAPLVGSFVNGYQAGRERTIARKLIHEGKNQEAIDHLTEALKFHKTGQSYATMGLAYENLHDYPEAIAALDKAADMMLNDASTKAVAKMKIVGEPTLGFVYSHMSTVYHAQKKLELAKDFADKAVEEEPNNALHHRYRAAVFYELGDTNKAIEDATKAIDIEPKTAVYYKARASYELHAKQFDKAIADCNSGLALEPDNPTIVHLKEIADRGLASASAKP